MLRTIIVIGLVFIGIMFVIYFNQISEKISNSKITKILKMVGSNKMAKIEINLILILIAIIICFLLVLEILNQIDTIKINKEDDEDRAITEQMQEEEAGIYSNIINQTYEEQAYDKPYMPDGFFYVEGTWDTGYVIQDEDGNQYVWVPCTNEEIDGVTKITKSDFENTLIKLYECYDTEYEEFLKSACTYGGFYIARYEIGKSDSGDPVSQKDKEIYTNVSKEEAIEIIDGMYDTDKFNIQLINSYAYDIALTWIGEENIIIDDEDDEEETDDEETEDESEEEELFTGRNQNNNIYDLKDSIFEITTEIYFNNCIVTRGASAGNALLNRITYYVVKYEKIGFRTIIYK